MTLINQGCIYQRTKSELHSGNDYYRSVQNRLSSGCLSATVKFETHKTIVFRLLQEYATWSLPEKGTEEIFWTNKEGGSNRSVE